MDGLEMCHHQLEVYTAHVCWRGKLATGAQRRVSDILNDSNQPYLTLENATMWSWNSNVRTPKGQMETTAIMRRNIVFVVSGGQRNHTDSKMNRVPRKTQRVAVFAPPFTLTGSLYFAREAHWTSVLNVHHQEFIPMTDTTILRMGENMFLPVQSGFVAVNRAWIESLFSIQPEPVDEAMPTIANQHAVAVG